MKYDFDEVIPRKNTLSVKYDFAEERGKPADILPLWVADMDFKILVEVRQQLAKSVEHAIFGYSEVKGDYVNALQNWFSHNFGFDIQPEWLVKTPGVVYATAMAVHAFTREGDSVMIQEPVYYPFSETILTNNRKLVNNELVYQNGRYSIDFVDFEKKIIENKVKLFILCSPHNPVGRVWTKEELIKMGDICLKHHCRVLSDEIHCDFVHEGHKHHIFGSLSPEFLNNSVICTAPSKTFNVAGLQVSNIFIANPELRTQYQLAIRKTGYSQLNTMGLIACQSAYENGRDWLNQLQAYLTGNLNFLRQFLAEKLPQIKLVEPEGTYLVWLDCKELGLTPEALDELIVHKAKLWLDDGRMFGESGAHFQRVNLACPKSVLETALLQLEAAIKTGIA